MLWYRTVCSVHRPILLNKLLLKLLVKLFAFINTSLLGRFAPIFYFSCEHVLFVYIVKQKKIIRGFLQKISWIFKILKNLMTIKFWWRQIFEILIIHKPSLGSLDVPQKIWARSVQPFWRLLDTNRQTDIKT